MVKLTTSSGTPIADDNNSVSAGKKGPLTFDNWQLMEKLAHFNRERIPERVVHARGNGAYGTFKLSKDLSKYTIAHFLQANKVNKETEIFVRFSTVGGGQDSSDYARDPRGFAVKFYTEEGNFDLVGNNTPVFFIRDPQKFPDFVHSQKKNPKTNLPNPLAMYEFWANHPQSMHQLTILMSDRGIPATLRHMNGYGSHTLSFWNDKGERFWIKWHLKTNQGIQTLTEAEAEQKPANDAQRDLVESIEKREFPSWTVNLQIMTQEQAESCSFNPFDLTKVWDHKNYPLIKIGTMILNKNVENYFAETEQAAFSPSNLVPGIGSSPDKVLQARLLAYPDAQRYRLGVNYNQLPVNSPRCPVNHYQRDGLMAGSCPFHKDSQPIQSSATHFYPNDQKDAPSPSKQYKEPSMNLGQVIADRFDTQEEDNFSQAKNLYNMMSDEQKEQLTSNIAGGLSQATSSIQQRMLTQFESVDTDYRKRIEAKL